MICGDCLKVMPNIFNKSIDMILCDLPYGTTACKWDIIIPFEPLWKEYKRLIKDNGAIVLTASQPFTSILVMSNLGMFKYCWVWDKMSKGNFMQANYQPLKTHEDIVIFSNFPASYAGKNKTMIYNPQKIKGYLRKAEKTTYPKSWIGRTSINYKVEHKGSNSRFPTSIIHVSNASHVKKTNPTQKPVALFEYLIKTYTNEGDLVLDNCAGSGTTGVACINTKRNYILIEKKQEYIDVANKRIKAIPELLPFKE